MNSRIDSLPIVTPMDAPKTQRWTRSRVIRVLRTAHGWIGLWGATLGLLFGVSGVLLNHRSVLKIPVPPAQESQVQLALPEPAPANAKAMAAWLQQTLKVEVPASRVKEEPARPVAWGDQALQQPARWQIGFAGPQTSLQAEYWVGNRTVSVKRSESGVLATLNNLHKGVGMPIAWILLVDTLAGGILLLSLSGLVLYVLTTRRPALGLGIAGGSMALTAWLVLAAL